MARTSSAIEISPVLLGYIVRPQRVYELGRDGVRFVESHTHPDPMTKS